MESFIDKFCKIRVVSVSPLQDSGVGTKVECRRISRTSGPGDSHIIVCGDLRRGENKLEGRHQRKHEHKGSVSKKFQQKLTLGISTTHAILLNISSAE